MDLALSETQTLIRDAIRAYLEHEVPFNRVRQLERDGGHDHLLWTYLKDAGFLGLPFPVSDGGSGGEMTDLAILLEELTRRAVIIPFAETMTSALAIQRFAEPAVAKRIVEAVGAGQMTISPAILEANDRFDNLSLRTHDGHITGEKRFVDYGNTTTHHLVAAYDGEDLGLYLVDAQSPQVSFRTLRHIGRTPQAHVSYSAAVAEKVGTAAAFEFLCLLGRSLAAIQCLANAQQALDMTVEYVAMRVQFGRPIGTFQAVQHHCANMATMVLASRYLCYEAVWKLDRGLATARDVAIAKAQASRTATTVPMLAHQLHGGIGFTEEYDLHFFSRRGKERAISWGTKEDSLRVIAETLEEVDSWL
jgi:alkylation response protein AidB-like acyl-CoA dehydrogenase